MGAIHVCEHVECKLPAEDWYQSAVAAGAAKSKGEAAPGQLRDGVSYAAATAAGPGPSSGSSDSSSRG